MHRPVRGNALICTRPRVHAGFLRSWTANEFSERVLRHIGDIVESERMDLSNVRVLLTGGGADRPQWHTGAHPVKCLLAPCPLYRGSHGSVGHSLGGSIACLAAFDIRQAFDFQRLQCYTFGAPRVGNSAFAKSYNEVVPATWHIINDQVSTQTCDYSI